MHIYIRAMSESQSEIHRKLSDRSEQIICHIIRLLLYPDSEYVNHWKKEIMSFLWRVDKLKGKNKYPSEKFILKALSTHNDTLEHYTSYVIDYEDELTPKPVSQENISAAIIEYQQWIAHELATDGAIRASMIYAKLDEIVNKYSN